MESFRRSKSALHSLRHFSLAGNGLTSSMTRSLARFLSLTPVLCLYTFISDEGNGIGLLGDNRFLVLFCFGVSSLFFFPISLEIFHSFLFNFSFLLLLLFLLSYPAYFLFPGRISRN